MESGHKSECNSFFLPNLRLFYFLLRERNEKRKRESVEGGEKQGESGEMEKCRWGKINVHWRRTKICFIVCNVHFIEEREWILMWGRKKC